MLAALIAAGVALYVSTKNNAHLRDIEERKRTQNSEVEFTQTFIVLEDFVLDYFGHGKDTIRLSATGFNKPEYRDENGMLQFDSSCVINKEKLGQVILLQTQNFDEIYLEVKKKSIGLKEVISNRDYEVITQTLKNIKTTFDNIRSDAHNISQKGKENSGFDEIYIHINTYERLEEIKQNIDSNTNPIDCLGYKSYMSSICQFYNAKESIKKIPNISKYF